jgi:hypothetical protein
MTLTELQQKLSEKYQLIGEPKQLQAPANAGTARLYSQDCLELSDDKQYGVFRTVTYYLYDEPIDPKDSEAGTNEIAFIEGRTAEKVL